MHAPLVSIITPAYNSATTLKETADSILAQTHERWEWIVVDNGSTDGTDEILSQLQNHGRVKVIHLEENLGVSGGRNAGLAASNGEFICFVDADDRLPKDSISRRLQVMQERPEVDFVDGAVQRIDVIGNELGMQQPEFEGRVFEELLSLSGKCFIGITWMIRRKEGVIYQFNPSIRHAEDLLFFLSIADEGIYTHVSDVIYEYRARKGSAMSDLLGLEKGYAAVEKEIKSWPKVSMAQTKAFHRKWRTIMIKSYLKEGHVNDALRLKLR
ncbi:MAG: glycosyltransferase family 2 protein [Flavobacteriales bacterium]|nr:glycosyltransferase family 2 protein [Flavobacteriales bacterium]